MLPFCAAVLAHLILLRRTRVCVRVCVRILPKATLTVPFYALHLYMLPVTLKASL